MIPAGGLMFFVFHVAVTLHCSLAPSHTCTSTPSFSDGAGGFDVVEWRD
jgi:hypothetical protein